MRGLEPSEPISHLPKQGSEGPSGVGAPNYPARPMQTRLLLIASAVLAVIILVAGAVWLIRLLA